MRLGIGESRRPQVLDEAARPSDPSLNVVERCEILSEVVPTLGSLETRRFVGLLHLQHFQLGITAMSAC
jgi:hypothetical protein